MGNGTENKGKSLIYWSAILPILYCASAVYGSIGLYNENKDQMTLMTIFCIILFAGQVVTLLMALFRRKWWTALLSLFGLVISIGVTLTCIVALAAGQYRPPVRTDLDEVDSTEVDSIENVEILKTDSLET